MIINKETKQFQTRSSHPDTNWTDDLSLSVISDESELAQKIIANYPNFEFVLDEDGNVTDITPIPPSDAKLPDPIGDLQNENRTLKAQLKAASESNAFLEDCLVEIAGIVYAG